MPARVSRESERKSSSLGAGISSDLFSRVGRTFCRTGPDEDIHLHSLPLIAISNEATSSPNRDCDLKGWATLERVKQPLLFGQRSPLTSEDRRTDFLNYWHAKTHLSGYFGFAPR